MTRLVSFVSVVTRLWTLSIVVALLAVGLVARHAYASATGVTIVPAFKINAGAGGASVDLPVPAGQLVHRISGSGRRINSQFAAYRANALGLGGLLAGRVCNWQIDFSYKTKGKEYMRERGKTIHECSGLVDSVAGRAKAKTLPHFGEACAELWVNGRFRAAQCHSITR